jgi:hypothetical protein
MDNLYEGIMITEVMLMIVVYHDVGGSHSTAAAANIHINFLPRDIAPNKDVILALPTFDKLQKKDWGHLIYIGDDEFGASVYTISRQKAAKIVMPALADLYNILKNTNRNEGLYLVDTSPTVNFLMALGGFLSRRVGLVSIGRPIVTYGTIKAYKNITNIVEQVKGKVQKDINTTTPMNTELTD